MSTPPLSKKLAKTAFKYVQRAIKDGFPISGRNSAVEEACRRFMSDFPGTISRRTFRDRYLAAVERFGFVLKLPEGVVEKEIESKSLVTPEEHAHARAVSLSEEITRLVTSSRYPLQNPDAILVESYVSRRYTRGTQEYDIAEGTPRTWVTSTLKVEPIPRSAGRKFLFTGAQNDAPIHEGFWTNLRAYAESEGYAIVCGPWTYETTWWNESNPTSRAYSNALSEYLCFGQMAVGNDFFFCGEMNTLPTAARPISDLVTYSRGRWGVFPHSKLQLKSLPSTDPAIQARQVMTTGAVTLPKVIARKAGTKSIFHHIIGATAVEFDSDGNPFCRQISATEDGSFYDLDRFVSKGKVTRGHRLKGLVCADIHRAKLRPVNTLATFGFNLRTGEIVNSTNIVDTMKPEQVFFHDIYDMQSRNHHNIHDNAMSYELAIRKSDSVLGEIRQVGRFIEANQRPDTKFVVVESNHDLALEKYVREGRYRNDGVNVRIGLQLEDAYIEYREKVAMALDRYEDPPKFSLLEAAVKQLVPGVTAAWVTDGSSYMLDGVECGHHGFRGANGAKGTVAGFARIGRKMSIGDKHAPEIMEAVYVAGSMELHHSYNKGPSSWATTHIFQYQNGKRSLVTLQNGKWHA